MTDELKDERDENEEEKEGDLPPAGPLNDEEETHEDDDFLEGFGDDSMDPEEADALAMGYRIRGNNAEEEEDDFFSNDDE